MVKALGYRAGLRPSHPKPQLEVCFHPMRVRFADVTRASSRSTTSALACSLVSDDPSADPTSHPRLLSEDVPRSHKVATVALVLIATEDDRDSRPPLGRVAQ